MQSTIANVQAHLQGCVAQRVEEGVNTDTMRVQITPKQIFNTFREYFNQGDNVWRPMLCIGNNKT